MPDIDLSSELSLFVRIIGLLTAAGVAFLFYRRTVPPLSAGWRVFLGTLRASVLFLLFFLFGEPLLSLLYTTRIPPAVAVLADNSRSMTLASENIPGVYDAVASSELKAIENVADLYWYKFDQKPVLLPDWLPDAIDLSGDRTDLTNAFEDLRSDPPAENFRAVILLSDGNTTSAVHPVYAAEALGAAVFTVGIGDSTDRRDVLISGVLHNSVAYAGTRLPIQVTVRNTGYENGQVDVLLTAQGTEADRSTVSLNDGTGDYRTTLFMTPDSAGTVRGEVIVSGLDGETTFENNRYVFFTTVLSGKRTILLVAGSPDQDAAFIRRSLASDSNLTVITRVQRPDGRFLGGELDAQLVGRSDAVFLAGFPGPFTTDRSMQAFASEEFRLKPVFFLLGRRTRPAMLSSSGISLPVTVQNVLPIETQAFVSVPEQLRRHPLLRLGDPDAWTSLPPVFRPQGRFTARSDAQVLAAPRIQSHTLNEPMLVARSVGGQRSVAMLAYGLWRWKMLSSQGGLPDSPFDTFLKNVVQWLTAVEDERPFRVSPVTASFSALEPVRFRAEVYDQSMQPVNDASVSIAVAGEGRSTSIGFTPVASGQYEAEGDVLPPGVYTYEAIAATGGIELGTDRGSFTVGGLQAEFLETRLNKDLLRNLALRTGGAYYDAGDLDGLSDSIMNLPGFEPQDVRHGSQVELSHSAWMLGLIIFLLSVEWFFRKRLGLL